MMLSALSLSVISLSAGEHVRVSEVWSQKQTEAAGKPCSILVVARFTACLISDTSKRS